MATLSTLPPEITREIVRYLSINSLLYFGLTSKVNHAIQECSMSTLRLGVFHSRLGGMISLMEATAGRDCLYSVQKILPKQASRTKDMVIVNQNSRIRKAVDRYRGTLRDLEVALWELQESSASSIAQLRNLQGLSIRLDHPHTRFSGVDPKYWGTSRASTVWNVLGSRSGKARALGRLRSLNLDRAGITDYQLAKMLEGNPRLTELRLRKCLALTDKAFKLLVESYVAQHLETLHFTKSDSDEIDERVLAYIGKLSKLKSLSLHGCHNVNSGLVKRLNDEQWHIPNLTLPSTCDSPRVGVEIDDEYK